MAAKALYRVVLAVVVGLFVWSSAPVYAKGGECSAVKTKAECGKKATCKWSGKACAAKDAKAAKHTGKAGHKATAKPAKAAAKPEKIKPAEAAPAEAAPADDEAMDEAPVDEAPAEGEEDF